MADLQLRTELFPTEPEGDLDGCNGMPGRALSEHVRALLANHGYQCDEPIQEDYGWHMWLNHEGLKFSVAVGLCGTPGEVEGIPEWGVTVVHECSLFSPSQWSKRKEGKAESEKIINVLRSSLASEQGMTVE